MKTILLSLLLLTSQFVNYAYAYDRAKEKRWVEQTVDFIVDGEAQWLDLGKHKALAIYMESNTDETKAGVIVVHGSGVHPNWQDIVQPLRTGLPDSGWATLSIQMPVLDNDADYKEYAPLFDDVKPRMDAAIKNLQDKGIKKIVIVAHSLGSAMSAYYLANEKNTSIKAFVAIGMPGAREDKRMNTLFTLQSISVPVLDLYGEKDLESVIDSAHQRREASSKNKSYSQKVVPGADHFFVNKNEELVSNVNDWLKNNIK
ncbi:MAG: alpha/beta hydrolase family protein [Gammaproteobacteria bacterium]|nr:alpha/beta hydrolase family protein [Gammaproteobacteria bacterium]